MSWLLELDPHLEWGKIIFSTKKEMGDLGTENIGRVREKEKVRKRKSV